MAPQPMQHPITPCRRSCHGTSSHCPVHTHVGLASHQCLETQVCIFGNLLVQAYTPAWLLLPLERMLPHRVSPTPVYLLVDSVIFHNTCIASLLIHKLCLVIFQMDSWFQHFVATHMREHLNASSLPPAAGVGCKGGRVTQGSQKWMSTRWNMSTGRCTGIPRIP